uniref:Uncharacterized protein n=1 Tax=Avena sativa TaxID=4498 RepID=A0ACD5YLK7_AVESA
MAPAVKFVLPALLLALVVGVSALEAAARAPAPLVARLNAAFSAVEVSAEQAADRAGGQGDGAWMMDCWNAVTELRSCTNEIALFFLSGDSYLGGDCCFAIRTITRHCWPTMLATVGFTVEEADILRGFCDAEVGAAHAPPSVPPTAPAPAQARSYL